MCQFDFNILFCLPKFVLNKYVIFVSYSCWYSHLIPLTHPLCNVTAWPLATPIMLTATNYYILKNPVNCRMLIFLLKYSNLYCVCYLSKLHCKHSTGDIISKAVFDPFMACEKICEYCNNRVPQRRLLHFSSFLIIIVSVVETQISV